MSSGFIVRFRPYGPWRIGPDTGARDRVDRVYHSDSLYSAVCGAMLRMGELDEWLDATARNAAGSEVRFSSCFPYQGDTLLAPPPAHLWPPQSTRLRWKGARFAPLTLISALLEGAPVDEDAWVVDGPSECVLPVDRNAAPRSPFRSSIRSSAAVDRMTGALVDPHSTACLEFEDGAGLWAAVSFAGEEAHERWSTKVEAVLRLLADSGLGGERSRGWGHSDAPRFRYGLFPDLVSSVTMPENNGGGERAWWLLSLFSPGAADAVDWRRGSYSLMTRAGRIESPVRSGDEKKLVRMVQEGSVLLAGSPPAGAAPDVAPDGFPHPVYRSGFALAIPIPWRVPA